MTRLNELQISGLTDFEIIRECLYHTKKSVFDCASVNVQSQLQMYVKNKQICAPGFPDSRLSRN